MDEATKKKLQAIIDKLPTYGETKFPSMTYEQGIEEVLMYLLGECDPDEFAYAVES